MDNGHGMKILQRLSNHFNMSNIDLNDLNITTAHLKYFIEYFVDKRKNSTRLQLQNNEKPSFPVDLLKQFDTSSATLNRSRYEDDSITVNHMDWISSIHSPSTSLSEAAACDCYCGGLWRETLLEYKTVHGYIALVVGEMRYYIMLYKSPPPPKHTTHPVVAVLH